MLCVGFENVQLSYLPVVISEITPVRLHCLCYLTALLIMLFLQCEHSVLYSLFNQYSMFDNSVFPFYLIIHTVDSVYMMSQDGNVNRVPAGL